MGMGRSEQGANAEGSGVPSLEEQMEDLGMELPTVWIETQAFSASTLALYDLPVKPVMDAMSTEEPMKIVKMFELFKMAIMAQERVEDFEALSYNEVMECMTQWVVKSNPGSRESSEF